MLNLFKLRKKKKVSKDREYRPTLLLDFDGVIHSYISGWQGVDVIPDPPVTHAWRKKGSNHVYDSIDWVTNLVLSDLFKVCIYSSRSKDPAGVTAMKVWLLDWGMEHRVLDLIKFPTTKPAAFLTVDDRAIKFEGEFIPADKLIKFRTWQGK
jgi:hypothetical protein